MSTSTEIPPVCEAGVVAIAFNKDRTQCAFSPNNHLIHIYSTTAGGKSEDTSTWRHIHTLENHDQAISGLDWHAENDQLLSCAQDRTAFVWVRQPFNATSSTLTKTSVCTQSAAEVWVPTLVLLDSSIKRGLTCCQWSTAGKKIYIGSAASNVGVGTFSEEDGWWMCRTSNCHNSTVTAIKSHPSNDTIIATGSTDGTVSLLSTTVKSVDGKGTGDKFGTQIARVKMPGLCWVYDVAWSPSGTTLAVATHDSRVHILTVPSATELAGLALVQSISLKTLPLRSLTFIGEQYLVCGGFDSYPILVDGSSGSWSYTGRWVASKGSSSGGGGAMSAVALARLQLQNEAKSSDKVAVEVVATHHKNVISGVFALTKTYAGDAPTKAAFVTTGMDGRVLFWKPCDMTAPTA